MEYIIGFIIGALFVGVFMLLRNTTKPTIMKIVYPDCSWFVGRRGNKEIGLIPHETKGTHHFKVLEASEQLKELIGWEIAVPIDSVKCLIIYPKDFIYQTKIK